MRGERCAWAWKVQRNDHILLRCMCELVEATRFCNTGTHALVNRLSGHQNADSKESCAYGNQRHCIVPEGLEELRTY